MNDADYFDNEDFISSNKKRDGKKDKNSDYKPDKLQKALELAAGTVDSVSYNKVYFDNNIRRSMIIECTFMACL